MRRLSDLVSNALRGGSKVSAEMPDPPVTPELAARRERIERIGAKTTEEVLSRKARSIAILKVENVPFSDDLPVIQDESESKRRSKEAIAMRASALFVVAMKGEGLERDQVQEFVEEYKLHSVFSPNERDFIEDPDPSPHDRVQFVWRYEGYWVMLWALGFVESLERPDHICDATSAGSFLLEDGHAAFLERANPRPLREILDAADLYYRYDWAAVNARIGGRVAPAGLDGGVVEERHYALNWLIGYMDDAWDDISTDT